MTYTYEFLSEAGCFVVTCSGRVSAQDMLELVVALESHPEFRPGLNRLVDFRSATMFLSAEQVAAISREIRDRDGLHGKRRVAFVVDDDVSYGVLRMAVGHSVLAQFELRVVRDQDEAKEWIGLSTDYVLPADR